MKNAEQITTLDEAMSELAKYYDMYTLPVVGGYQFAINPKNGNPPYYIAQLEDGAEFFKAILNQRFIWAENAIKNCLFEWTFLTNMDLTPEELNTFKNYKDIEPCEDGFNDWMETFFPMLVKRIDYRNNKVGGPVTDLKIHQFGHELTTEDEPIIVHWNCKQTEIDLTKYKDHKAKICENGQIAITSLTKMDGTVIDCIEPDNVEFREGITLTPEPQDWLNLKAEAAQIYSAISRAAAKLKAVA